MLRAILKGKASNPAIEDTLTAGVFGRLMYLNTKLIWSILSSSFLSDASLQNSPIDYENTEFWPHWWLEKDKKTVEPDIILRFDQCDLIVEAKRWDSYMQNPHQLVREWISYHEQQLIKKKVFLLAVGGLGNSPKETILTLQSEINKIIINEQIDIKQPLLIGTSWRRLYEVIHLLQSTENITEYENAILNDIQETLRIHDIEYREPKWFIDFSEQALTLCNIQQSSLKYFKGSWA